MTRSLHEIRDMLDYLEDNICDFGWEPTIDGASRALTWVLGESEKLTLPTAKPEAERREYWISQGGKPESWPGDCYE